MTTTWSVILTLGLILVTLVPVLCQTSDYGQCTINRVEVVPDASVRFALLMSLRKNDSTSISGYTCSQLSREPLQNFLAAEWAVERLNQANNGTGYIPGVKIGFYGMDDCRSAVYSSRNALSFLDIWVPTTVASCLRNQTQALPFGIVGPSRSSTATRVASLLRDVPIPIISSFATSSDLSNTSVFPTFFRTVPPDHHQMTMMVQILEQMSWTYIAVVHSNDDYGLSAVTQLKKLTSEKGICISQIINLGVGEVPGFNSQLQTLIKAARGNSIAIPFIGSRDNADFFVVTLNKLGRVDNKEIRFGFRLILSESTNTDVTIFTGREIGIGTLAVGVSNLFLNDVYNDLEEKIGRVKTGLEKHPLIEQYVSSRSSDPLLSPKMLDTFVPLTIHAVFVLAEALRLEHLAACGLEAQGVCAKLKTNVQNGNMLDRVRNVKVNYGALESGLPPDKFRESNFTISFDEHGDVKLINRIPLYTLYQYRGNQQTLSPYEVVGNYVDGQTILHTEKLKFLTPSGYSSQNLPTSVCVGDCLSCLNNKAIPIAFLPGDVYIIGVFSLHDTNRDDPFTCGQFRNIGNDAIAVEGFLYTVRDLERLTGIKFGAVAIDDCYSPLRAVSILSDYLSGLIGSVDSLFDHRIPKGKIAGVLACRSSGCTIPTARFFMPLNLPVVSYSASSSDLDNKLDFPYFLRTVPSDVYQTQVMLQICSMMSWEYVGVLYVKNNYGSKAMQEFKNRAINNNPRICVATEIGISELDSVNDQKEFRDACLKFNNLNVKVVIFFGIDVRFKHFLNFMETDSSYRNFIFIGGEDWGVNRDIYQAGRKSSRGSLTLKVQDIQLETYSAFKSHLAAKVPTANDRNIWFSEFWQRTFNCSLQGGFINNLLNDCSQSTKFSPEMLEALAGEQRVNHVMNAVYALGKGLAEFKSLCEDDFPCDYFFKHPAEVVSFIQKQTREQDGMTFRVFDSNGNGAIGFDVYNIQPPESPDGNPYVKVGTFNTNDDSFGNKAIFRNSSLKFYSENGVPLQSYEAKCSQSLCQHCQVVLDPSAGPVNKGGSSDLKEFRQSDILMISLNCVLVLALLVAIAAIILCVRQRCAGVKKLIHNCREEIYDEPDRNVYSSTHGIKFANAMNPYPVLNSLGPQARDADFPQGVSNLAFVQDSDSVSQVGPRANQSDPGTQATSDQVSFVPFGQFVTPYSSRPLPLSPIGAHPQEFGSPMYAGSGHETSKKISLATDSNMTGPSDQSARMRNLDTLSLASGQVRLIPSSSLRGQAGRTEGVVYYMQGANGQLAPYMSLSAEEREELMQQLQSSARSQASNHSGSVAASSINMAYGPYSSAALQRQQLQQQQQQQQQQQLFFVNNPMPVTSLDARENPIMLSRDLTRQSLRTSRGKPSIRPTSQDQEADLSPIRYASSSRDKTDSAPSTVHYQTPPSRASQQLDNMSPMLSKNEEFHDIDEDSHHSLLEDLVDPTSGSRSPDRSPDLSRHSMMSSVPDLIGHSSPNPDLERQASLVTVDLTSSKESLDDLDTEVKGEESVPAKRGKSFFKWPAGMAGNTSRV